ncbi:MAG: type IV pilus secretin PilQ [Bdellovibrionales bacterium]|nr:type IV pilus secretin PilQ [Bdellovibrionales bacterium]
MKQLKTVSILSGLALFATANAFALTKITRIEFFGKSSPNQMVVVGDGPIEFEKIDNPADKQVIFEIKNAQLANSNAGRRLDTASFNSKVALISPYNVESKHAVRIIVQLRENTDLSTVAEGSRLFVGIDGAADPNILPATGHGAKSVAKGGSSAKGAAAGSSGAGTGSSSGGGSDITPVSRSAEVAPAGTPEGRIDQFLDASSTKRYVGRHITLQVKDADIVDVFKLIGETSGFNMVIGSDVNGKLNLSLVDVPWDLALDTILSTNKLGAERTGNVLRVAQLSTLTQEKQAQQAAKLAAENSAPRITRIFPLSYATGASLMPILSRFGAGNAGTGAGAARDTIIVDDRTNSLIVQDTSDNLERMAKIIKLLDRQTPQVQIEAKIVDASEEFSKSMSGAFALGADPSWGGLGGSFLQGISDPILPGGAASAAASNALGMKLKIGALASMRLGAILNLAESESRSRIISAPRTVVLNKQAATIVQGQPVLVPVTVQTQNGSASSTEVRSANLSLNVTPTVTNDGNIVMQLSIANDTPKDLGNNQTGVANRNMTTQVVAESGSTIAIGGIYTSNDTSSETGIPGLRKLPIIGALFGNESKKVTRSELFIFITPRVLNEEVMSTDLDTKQSSAMRASSLANPQTRY